MASGFNHFIELDELKQTFSYYIPKPLIYGKPEELNFIISTDENETDCSPGLYQYNLENNTVNLLKKYNGHVTTYYHGQFIDKNNKTLYIITEQHAIPIINLETKETNFNTNLIGCKTVIDWSSTLDTQDFDNLVHIFSKKEHIVYKSNNNTFTVNNNEVLIQEKISWPKPLCIFPKKRLMLLGSFQSDKILYCDIPANPNEDGYKWKRYKLNMPYVVSYTGHYDFIVAFEYLIFVFYFLYSGHLDIYCLDTYYEKWFKSNYTVPKCMTEEGSNYVFKTKNNVIHMVGFISKHHFKADLHDLIPEELQILYAKKYEPLVIGFIKEKEQSNIIPTIPFVIKQLIWRYFPLFL